MEDNFVIRTDSECEEALNKIDILMNNSDLTEEERKELDKLVNAVIIYEDIHWKIG